MRPSKPAEPSELRSNLIQGLELTSDRELKLSPGLHILESFDPYQGKPGRC